MELKHCHPAILLTVVAMLATTTTQAAVFKCKQGGQTVYSDQPCPDAKPVDTTNGKAPELADQYMAKARVLRDKAKVMGDELDAMREQRERAECQEMAARHNVTMQTAAKYQSDAWWVNRARSSAVNLNERCGKNLIPNGAR